MCIGWEANDLAFPLILIAGHSDPFPGGNNQVTLWEARPFSCVSEKEGLCNTDESCIGACQGLQMAFWSKALHDSHAVFSSHMNRILSEWHPRSARFNPNSTILIKCKCSSFFYCYSWKGCVKKVILVTKSHLPSRGTSRWKYCISLLQSLPLVAPADQHTNEDWAPTFGWAPALLSFPGQRWISK